MIWNLNYWLFVPLFHHILPLHSCSQYQAANTHKTISDGRYTTDWSLAATEQTVTQSLVQSAWMKEALEAFMDMKIMLCVRGCMNYFPSYLAHTWHRASNCWIFLTYCTWCIHRRLLACSHVQFFHYSLEVYQENIGRLPERFHSLLNLLGSTCFSSQSAMCACIPTLPFSVYWSCRCFAQLTDNFLECMKTSSRWYSWTVGP